MQNVLSLARTDDLEALLPLMRAYAAFDGLAFDEKSARTAMSGLLGDARLGRVAFVCDGATRCGYLALCYGYSIELGGRDGFLDELYVEPAFRNRGLGTRALEAACELARADGVRALHLEVRRGNVAAQRYYERAGFVPRDRYHLLTRGLG
jgi:ribosomal protein S18 acetylase RimI-like enzyme